MLDVIEYLKAFYSIVQRQEQEAGARWPNQQDRLRFPKIVVSRISMVGAILSDLSLGRLASLQLRGSGSVPEFVKVLMRDLLFVGLFSYIEYEIYFHLGRQRAQFPTVRAKLSGDLRKAKFSDMISWANRDGLIDDMDLWTFALGVRNDIVHFDGYARQTKPSPKNLDYEIIMSEGEQLSGKLRSFPALTKGIELSAFELLKRAYS